jgi:hypothetical protein
VSLANAMPHKTRTLSLGEKKCLNGVTHRYKIEEYFSRHQRSGSHSGIWAYSLSKLNIIKNQQYADYILKRHGNMFAICMAYEKYKDL